MILTYTPAELYGMLSGNTNCLSSITYDSSYLYFDTLGSDKYGFFANIPVIKNFILEYDLVCVGSIYPSFNPTFGSDSIDTTNAQYYGFMVAFYDKLEVWRGRNLSYNPSPNSRIASAISATDYSNAVVVDTSVHVKIQRDTSTISVYLDDTLYQTVTSNDAQASNAGYFGFFNWSGTSCKISNFKITSNEIGGSGILKYLNFTGLSNLVTDIKNWITARIPTKTSEITNDSGFITSSSLPTVNNATLTIQKNGTNVQTFTANASSNKTANITVPTKTSELTNDSGYITGIAWGSVTGKPSFATVATSGSYSDLSDKPTIPTVNNATLTIQKNGTTVKTFTANASSNVTCNITVPTKTSELTNDSGFLTAHQSLSNYVTLNSAQTISAVKTFTAAPISTATNYPNFTVKNTAHTVGEAAPSSTFGYGEFLVKDSAGYSIGLITVYYDKNQTMFFRIQARNKFTNGAPAVNGTEIGSCLDIGTIKDGTRYIYWNGYVGNSVAPRVNNSYDLGDSSHKWKTCYATNFYGALTGNVTGNCSGSSGSCTGNAATATTAENVTGTVAIANGGTGATTRLNAVKALTNENVGTGTDYFLTITSSWGKAGYCSVANAKTVLGLKSAAYTESSAYAAASHTHSQYLTEHQSLSNYSTKANTVKSLSISGKTITVTPGSGSAYTLTTQDTVYTHPTSAGNKHIPSGGSSGQILKYSSSGTAVWADVNFARTFEQIATRTSTGTWTISGVTKNTIIYVVGTVTSSGSPGATIHVQFTSGISGNSSWGNSSATFSGGYTDQTSYFFIAAFASSTSVKVSITASYTSEISAVSLKAYQ